MEPCWRAWLKIHETLSIFVWIKFALSQKNVIKMVLFDDCAMFEDKSCSIRNAFSMLEHESNDFLIDVLLPKIGYRSSRRTRTKISNIRSLEIHKKKIPIEASYYIEWLLYFRNSCANNTSNSIYLPPSLVENYTNTHRAHTLRTLRIILEGFARESEIYCKRPSTK